MEKLNLRDSGPFTPQEAAKRVALASQQLKWFTLCHPHWDTAHFNFERVTAYPLPALNAPKGARITCLENISCEFKLSRSGGESIVAAMEAQKKLNGIAHFYISTYGRGFQDKLGVSSLHFELNSKGGCDVEATVFHPNAKGNKKVVAAAIKAGHLGADKDWKLVKSEPYGDSTETELAMTIAGKDPKIWRTAIDAILLAQPKPLQKASWTVSFKYENWCSLNGKNYPWNGNKKISKNWDRDWWKGSSWKIWKPVNGKPSDLKGNPEELLKLVNVAVLPSGKATIAFQCTVEKVADFLGLFKLATACEPSIDGPVGIFETDKGKQGFMLFDSTRKGIKFNIRYGPNGWEELHEAIRQANGKLVR